MVENVDLNERLNFCFLGLAISGVRNVCSEHKQRSQKKGKRG